MGEVITIASYLERKAGEMDRNDIPERLATIALEMLNLQSEKNRLERILLAPPDTIA